LSLKTRVLGAAHSENFMILSLHCFDTDSVTDRQMDECLDDD